MTSDEARRVMRRWVAEYFEMHPGELDLLPALRYEEMREEVLVNLELRMWLQREREHALEMGLDETSDDDDADLLVRLMGE